MQPIYEFKREDAINFSNQISGRKHIRGDELVFQECPYCHGGDNHDRDTFSINLTTGQYKCQRSSCSAHGNMITLSKDFNFKISDEIDRYYNRDDYNGKFKQFKKSHIVSSDPAIAYLQSRGISKEVCKRYHITTKTGTKNILVFPFLNPDGEMKFIKYRKTDFDKTKDKSKEWCEKDCMPILFGMDQCDPNDFKQLVITEGQIDSLSLTEAGIKNAVSVPMGKNGFTWIPHVWDWLVRFDEIVVFGDCEDGHITLSDELTERFPNRVRIVTKESYCGRKDANDILRNEGANALIKAVNTAKETLQDHVIRLADVPIVDIMNTETIKTMIPEVDEILSGGIHVGQVILLTGRRGDGKSTFMSQLILNATEQGFNTFAYSGEMEAKYFRSWIDVQACGISDNFKTSKREQIGKWYYDNIFLYDNNSVDDEMDDIIPIAEREICKNNCKLICIDNLMTAVESPENDKLYRAQSKFVGRLARLAKLHNVVALLVAHPRKTSNELTNDDVSGSADITNRVDVVMAYSRNEDSPEDERELKVTKNRLTGKLTRKNQIVLHYNTMCKRIVGADKDFSYHYGWERDSDGFVPVNDGMEVPF